MKTVVLTDASRLHGIGFALVQIYKDKLAQRQSNPRPKLDTINLPGDAKQPMLHTACDLFSATGKQWLALIDRFSGYVWTIALRKLDTKAIILHLEQWFNDYTHSHRWRATVSV